MRGINFVAAYFLTTIFSLVVGILFLISLNLQPVNPIPYKMHYKLYQALPSLQPGSLNQEASIERQDARIIIVRNFFTQRQAPLAEHAAVFVKVADKNNLDFRLLPAISMQESNGGKRIPFGSYNPFGYGVYGNKVLHFNSFPEAIEKVAAGIKKDYVDKGLKNPYQIMTKYTPPALEKGGNWAIAVESFLEQMR